MNNVDLKIDCFAFIKISENTHKCNALSELNCLDCAFYKNKDEYRKQLAEINRNTQK